MGCGVIEKWATCIINHFYFSVSTAAARVTTAERRDELVVAIWVSLLNHIQNKHCDHSEEYANCEHGDLLPRKWIFQVMLGFYLKSWTRLWQFRYFAHHNFAYTTATYKLFWTSGQGCASAGSPFKVCVLWRPTWALRRHQ